MGVAMLVILLVLGACGGQGDSTTTTTRTVVETSTPAAEGEITVGEASAQLQEAAVDAAAAGVVVISMDDSPEVGVAYDELADWLNGKTARRPEQIMRDIRILQRACAESAVPSVCP